MESTVNEPHEISEAENKANGKEAAAYFNEDGSYVTVEDESGLIIQVSNRNDPDWEPHSIIKILTHQERRKK
ncbi:colicin E5-related ribonuclease [Paenibacillus sp. 1781tsa1]|uniref:colicin E5-related ribonuclease n=1 Tax=Paenibacillus sp. 1781tsa1 TaxID=2953810 RepID=UPI00345F367D